MQKVSPCDGHLQGRLALLCRGSLAVRTEDVHVGHNGTGRYMKEFEFEPGAKNSHPMLLLQRIGEPREG